MTKRKGRPTALRLSASPMPAGTITKAEFARLLGCAPARVTEWSRDILKPPALTPDGRVNPRLAAEALVAAGAVLPAAPPATTAETTEPPSYDESRARHEAAKADLAELELAARRTELVQAATAEGLLFAATRAFRDGLMTWPVRVAPEMAARLGVAPAALLVELEGGIREFLMALADPKAAWRQEGQR